MWVVAVIAYPPAMAAACVAAAVHASRRGRSIPRGLLPFRTSIGDQAERWLQAQTEPLEP